MKKLFFIAYLIACTHTAIASRSSQANNPVEQFVRIMMSNTNPEDQIPYFLTKKRNSNDYQDVYNLATKHPKLLKGIIHDGQTFAMLCVQRGHADVLERLINEGYPVDLTTPCLDESRECQTTVLHNLLGQVWQVRLIKESYSEDYSARITGLTKLIINKYPDLLDIPVNKARTARSKALERNLYDLIPRNIPQSPCIESELLDACKACDLPIVQKLIKNPGIDVNKGDEHGCTPLIIASQKGPIEILEVLLSLKKPDGSLAVNVNKSNMDGTTPLLAACQKRRNHAVKKLIEVPGIDVNQADNNGDTPLLVACKNNSSNLNIDIIDILLKNGAVNKANKKGETPLEITKGTLIYGQLELYLVGEVHASESCSALSPKDCKDAKEWELKHRKAKDGIAFHE